MADPNGSVAATGTGVSGSGTTKVTMAGTLAQVNAALGSVTDTDAAGTADTLTVNAADSLGNNAAAASVAITALGRTYTLTTAPTTITGTAGNDTIIATNATLISRDHIDAAGGANKLQLSGGGSFDLGAPAQLANIGVVVAQEGQAAGGGIADSTQTIYLRDGLDLTVNVTSGTPNAADTNPETINDLRLGCQQRDQSRHRHRHRHHWRRH